MESLLALLLTLAPAPKAPPPPPPQVIGVWHMRWGSLDQPNTIFRSDGTYESGTFGSGKWWVKGDQVWFTEKGITYVLEGLSWDGEYGFATGYGEHESCRDRAIILGPPQPPKTD